MLRLSVASLDPDNFIADTAIITLRTRRKIVKRPKYAFGFLSAF